MSSSKGKTRKEVQEALEAEAKQVLTAIEKLQNPKLKIPLRTLTNVYFDAKEKMIKLGDKEGVRSFYNVNQAKKFMQTMLIAAQLKSLILQDSPTLGTRQLFYLLRGTMPDSDEDKFDEQDESDAIIEDIEVMVDALREELGLIAVPKGTLAGPITIKDLKTGDILDYTKFGTAGGSIPASVEPDTYEFKKCTADYILVVEKYEVWNLLNQQRYWEKNNCLLMTGKGQPARAETPIRKCTLPP